MGGRDPFDFESRVPAPGIEPVRAPSSAPPLPPPGAAGFDRPARGAAGPPAGWLVAALLVALAAAVGALTLGGDVALAFLCWVLAGPAGIGLVAVFVLRDTRARSGPLYIRPAWIGALHALTVIAVVAGIGASAWRIADWWGRL